MAINPWTYAKASEHSHQTALFMWANMAQHRGALWANEPMNWTTEAIKATQGKTAADLGMTPIPRLKWLHAIHNQGHGDAVRGAKAKAEGVKAGVFDLFLPVPVWQPGAHNLAHTGKMICGLYLELKVGKNQMSAIQSEFAADMTRAGYACECAWGWLEARDKILAYLQINS